MTNIYRVGIKNESIEVNHSLDGTKDMNDK